MVVGPEEDIAMKVHLTVLSGRHRGQTIPITQSPFLIGRDPAAHLRPNSPSIGKQHCAILVDERGAMLQDFAHSTRLNERPIEGAAELTDGDCFQIGPLAFLFSVDPGPSVSETSVARTSSDDDNEAAIAAMLLSKTDKSTKHRPTSADTTTDASDSVGQETTDAAPTPESPSESAGTANSAREILQAHRHDRKEQPPTGGTITKRFEARPHQGSSQMASVYTITETRPEHVVIHRQSGPRPPEGFRQVHASMEEATLHLRGLYLGCRITLSAP
jgi:pSer/pThr/pTyr-binding forkhead associated (FHA) protein